MVTLVKENRLWAFNKICSVDLKPSRSQFSSSLDYYSWNYLFFCKDLDLQISRTSVTKNLKKNIPVIFKVQVVRELRNLKKRIKLTKEKKSNNKKTLAILKFK